MLVRLQLIGSGTKIAVNPDTIADVMEGVFQREGEDPIKCCWIRFVDPSRRALAIDGDFDDVVQRLGVEK